MTYIKHFIIAFCLLTSGVFAQEEIDSNVFRYGAFSMKRTARKAAENKDYNAIAYYKYYLSNKPSWPKFIYSKPKMMFELADVYRLANDYKNAESYYQQAYTADPKHFVHALYYKGAMQKMLGDVSGAKETFEKFKKEGKNDQSSNAAALKKLVKVQIAGCDSINVYKNKGQVIEINHLDTSINKAYMDVSPIVMNPNAFVYVSLKSDTLLYFNKVQQRTPFLYAPVKSDTLLESEHPLVEMKPPLVRFYVANRYGETWTDSIPFNNNLNIDSANVENGCFNAEKDKFYYTIKEYNPADKKKYHVIYLSKKIDGEWQKPERLKAPVNIKGFSSTMPSIGYDEKEAEVLFFVSNRNGSKGGMDIWYSVYDEAKKVFTAAKNAGNKVNSAADEITPYYDNENKVLYFSSEGWPGMGGFDVFKSFGQPSKLGAAVNLRAPINTHVHDIYYVVQSKGDEGFISSNREGSIALKHQYCCFDLYEHKKTVHLAIDLLVYKSENKHNIKNVFDHNRNEYTDKTIIDSTELKLYLVSDSVGGEDILIKQIPIDKRGKLLLKLEQNEKYRFIVSRPGYFANGFEFSTKNMTKSDTIFQPVGLHNLSKQPIVIPNIYYEFDKANLTSESTITIDTTIYKILIENPDIIAEIGSHTDARGSDEYNIVLSQKRAESVVNYLISKNIDPKRLRAKGYGETKFIAPNEKPDGSDDPEGRQRNRRTEFRIVGQIDKYSEIIYTE